MIRHSAELDSTCWNRTDLLTLNQIGARVIVTAQLQTPTDTADDNQLDFRGFSHWDLSLIK